MALVNQAVCSNCGRSDCDGRIWEDAEDPTRTWTVCTSETRKREDGTRYHYCVMGHGCVWDVDVKEKPETDIAMKKRIAATKKRKEGEKEREIQEKDRLLKAAEAHERKEFERLKNKFEGV